MGRKGEEGEVVTHLSRLSGSGSPIENKMAFDVAYKWHAKHHCSKLENATLFHRILQDLAEKLSR